jgi:hypothetical protein
MKPASNNNAKGQQLQQASTSRMQTRGKVNITATEQLNGNNSIEYIVFP